MRWLLWPWPKVRQVESRLLLPGMWVRDGKFRVREVKTVILCNPSTVVVFEDGRGRALAQAEKVEVLA